MVDSIPVAETRASADLTGAVTRLGWPRVTLLFVGFAALGFALFRPALVGPPVSDDLVYIVYNPYIAELSAENLREILDPWGAPATNTVNYAPVHLLLHALEVQLLGEHLYGYHVVNVLVHALNALLLVLLLLRSGIPWSFALLGGALFAVHPANVEVVAWVSQLKTSAALAWGLGALLTMRRHPLLASALFALALLTKAAVACILPMAVAFTWVRRPQTEGSGGWRLMAFWTLLLAIYAVPEFAAFRYSVAVDVPAYADVWVHARTIAAIGMRYLVMAATGIGVSAFQEPAPALAWSDPWFMASLPVGAVLGWRTWVGLRNRREEAGYWVGAAAAFVPVSQIFPFIFPMGDRYLYFILPGLIGGSLLAGREVGRRLAPEARRRRFSQVVLVAAGVACLFFAAKSAQRAQLWRSELLLLADAARHFPDGGSAHFVRALQAISAGDKQGAVVALRDAVDRGFDRVRDLDRDSLLEPIRDTPEFRELMREIAGRRIALGRERGYTSQLWLHQMAAAHRQREEYAEAAENLERALQTEGPLDEALLRRELNEVRRLSAARERGSPDAAPGDGE